MMDASRINVLIYNAQDPRPWASLCILSSITSTLYNSCPQLWVTFIVLIFQVLKSQIADT